MTLPRLPCCLWLLVGFAKEHTSRRLGNGKKDRLLGLLLPAPPMPNLSLQSQLMARFYPAASPWVPNSLLVSELWVYHHTLLLMSLYTITSLTSLPLPFWVFCPFPAEILTDVGNFISQSGKLRSIGRKGRALLLACPQGAPLGSKPQSSAWN